MGQITLVSNRVNDNLANINMSEIAGCTFTGAKLYWARLGVYPLPNSQPTPVRGTYTIKSDGGTLYTLDMTSGTIIDNTSRYVDIYPYFNISADSFLTSANQRTEIANPEYCHAGGSIGIGYDTMTVSKPTNVSINRNDVLSDISLSFTKQTTKNTNIKAYQGATLVGEWNTSGTSIIIPKNTLPTGDVKFVLINQVAGVNSATEELTVSLVAILPTITILEPDSVNQNLNLPIVVNWTSANQSQFKLTIDGNIYAGSTATGLIIPANTLTAGTKTMTLEVTYIPPWATSSADHRKITKTVTFLAYGNPPTPTLLNNSIISSATPLI